jgi:hypothetical protein
MKKLLTALLIFISISLYGQSTIDYKTYIDTVGMPNGGHYTVTGIDLGEQNKLYSIEVYPGESWDAADLYFKVANPDPAVDSDGDGIYIDDIAANEWTTLTYKGVIVTYPFTDTTTCIVDPSHFGGSRFIQFWSGGLYEGGCVVQTETNGVTLRLVKRKY